MPRHHHAVCLLALTLAGTAFGQGLPDVPVPTENPITEAKRVLGKMLFWDEQIASDNTIACGTCHRPMFGGTDPRLGVHPGPDGIHGFDDPETGIDDLVGSPGVFRADAAGDYQPDAIFDLEVQVTRRSANPSIMAMYASELFWDGRAADEFVDPETETVSIATFGALESQAVGPIVSDVEMAHEGRTWADVANKLAAVDPMGLATNLPADVDAALDGNPSYPDLFQEAFGTTAITAERIAYAIATYERTLVPDQTPYDLGTMTAEQQNGFELLTDHTVCFNCHVLPLFTDNNYYNVGMRPSSEDLGRWEVTGLNADRGRFKTPTLRGAGLKMSSSHVGWLTDVQDAIDFYNADTQDTRHRQFPEDQDGIPPVGRPYGLINMPEFIMNDPKRPFQAPVIDFIENGLADPRVVAATFPFDRPTLHSEAEPANPLVSGDGTPGTGGFTPGLIATTPPLVGNADFKVGVTSGLGGAEAWLAFSRTPPVDGVLEDPDEMHGPFALNGTGAGAGYATWHWAIPDQGALISDDIYLQWFVTDPEAPEGVARTPVAHATLFCHRACPCAADFDGGGGVDFGDLLLLLAAWGECEDCPEDLDESGTVDFADLLALLAAWGPCE